MAKILIVDDSKFMRLTLKNILEKQGGHIIAGEAENDKESLEQYKKLLPDLVTMDIIIPFDSGLLAVKEIINFDPKAKIIMVSAMGQEKIVQEAITLGAKGFVMKPIGAEKLLEAVKKALE